MLNWSVKLLHNTIKQIHRFKAYIKFDIKSDKAALNDCFDFVPLLLQSIIWSKCQFYIVLKIILIAELFSFRIGMSSEGEKLN